jgi:hypothetical protein
VGDRGRRKWWVSGCLVVSGVVVLAVSAVAGLIWVSVRSAEPLSSTLVHEPADIDVAIPQDDEPTIAGTPLQVLLELDSCEVYIEPGAPGEPLSVEAHYDAHDYRLEEIADEGSPGVYRLRFLASSSRLITGIKQALRGGQPQLRIRLPVDTPMELKLVQRNGGAIVDLSGLHLSVVEFDVGGALLKVDADERLQGDLERFTVKGSQGGVVLESLNLMQPQRLDIDFRMGQAQLDFRGPWTSDTTVQLSMSVADTIVRLPREARVIGLGTDHLASAPTAELDLPTLTFAVESGTRATLRVFE